jgi:hypothetical protein
MAPPPVQLNAGLTLIRSRHNGQRNFIVQLLDKDAKTIDLVANVIGAYDGTKAIRVPVVGQYTLNIQADGNWTIDILQPGPAELAQNAKLPQTFSGQGAQITPFFAAQTGALRLALKHDGSRNFIVILLDSRGQTVDLSANVIGTYEGSKIVRIPANGVYLFTVTADGAWSIDAGQ